MRVLLDTHTFLWAITDDPQLSRRARDIIIPGRNQLWFSAASVWEALIKAQIGKLPLPKPAGPYLKDHLIRNDVQVLPIALGHVLRLESLPLHHRDPFDRILVAQSLEEDLPILTADPFLANYSAHLIW